ncbi:bacterial type II secretion system protein F domain protein [Clostridiales bacterium oral taxon 876 str. F0540]|nr:bacterial type II secretion system protein F domain protein [Clostridiales bacterium oral taxon 876 str. F0540]
MPLYIYKAKNIQGNIIKGKYWLENRESLVIKLRKKGYYLVKHNELFTGEISSRMKKISSKELSILCSEFSSLIESGMNIYEILNLVQEEAGNKHLKRSLEDIKELIQEGTELSCSMKAHNDIYPEFFTNMIKVGEETGRLQEIFSKLSKYYSDESIITGKIKKAMLYPCTLFIFSIIISQILISFIVPVFVSTLTEMGGQIPVTTKFIISFNKFLKENYCVLLGILSFFIIGILKARKHKEIKIAVHKFLLTNKITKRLSRKILCVRFSRILGTLINSGIHIVHAMEIASTMMENEYAKSKLQKSIHSIRMGESIAKSIRNTDIFLPSLYSMIKIGEESGSLDSMLQKANLVMEQELYIFIEKVTVLLEPAMILVLSFFIGFILISLLMPMFNIMNTI